MSNPTKRNSQTSPDSRTAGARSPIDEASREQCLRYLLGKMDENEIVQFQIRLESEPAISNELVTQSDLICLLAGDQSSLQSPTVATQHSSASINVMPWVQWIAAIAASLLVGFIFWTSNSDQQRQIAKQVTADKSTSEKSIVHDGLSETDEELLIAQAWADGPLSLALASRAGDADIEPLHESDSESFEPNEESDLDWMMVAVTEGANHEG